MLSLRARIRKGRFLMPIDQLAFARAARERTPPAFASLRPCLFWLGATLACGVLAPPVLGQASNLANPAALNEKAPAAYKARFDTSKGIVVIDVRRDWAPNGADRFYNLVKNGFYDDTRFFRVISGFMVQFGINGDPKISAPWRTATIKDDPVKQSNKRGYITFATSGPDSRTSQVFINFADNGGLDRQGFSPFGQVSSGMEVVDALYSGYGEGAPQGRGPDQSRIQREGNNYLMKDFPRLDYVKKASIDQ
jgi:peptidyl-prolyl cis-trans isomerase A (cyclophilin A)